ncbi:ATP-binding cassette domain-containing protein [Saprospira sp. CCB-QB6]|uniref:ABC transporter ATP-binding protein n=1 Tax=Saprospira sp. CCB-QB6 TaxID=3023936 RepID=UPI00234A268C|nr:ATP-binding cassette domain-containing protein [Saprospira sp. CCB-QB6]WCL82647.1 ATP-binding cassette domain-containing protein [Saprospira sp. CCB-QB6]
MLSIELQNLAKRYRYEWIFKGLNYTFEANTAYAIRGHNGAGKSTLLQCLSGFLSPSAGQLRYQYKGKTIDREEVFQYCNYLGPYVQLIEELSLMEAIDFHRQFKPLLPGISPKDLFELSGLPNSAKNKPIQFFSSGMKQRLKLSLALLSESPLLLLDEPSITLDRKAVAWFQDLLERYGLPNRLCIIASNVDEDLLLCQQQLQIEDFKAS